MNQSKYTHNCPNCIFLDHINNFDFYFCTKHTYNEFVFVRRYGNEKGDFRLITIISRKYLRFGYGKAISLAIKRKLFSKTDADNMLNYERKI